MKINVFRYIQNEFNIKYDSDFEDAKKYEHNRDNTKYPLREKIYLDSLNVPLPSWASYRKTIQKPNSKSN